MSPIKRLFRSPGVRAALVGAAARYIRLVDATTRWTVVRPPPAAALEAAGQPYITCFWHGRLMMMGAAWQRPPARFHMLISGHRDGQLISRTIGHLGFPTVAGSSQRGGALALRAIQRVLAAGDWVGITPDGPRGPRMRAKPGPIKAAQLAGVPILPVTYAVSCRRVIGSWDRFHLALPMARGVILWGEPIVVPRAADKGEQERLRRLLEQRLNELTAEADRRCGHAPIEPEAVGDEARRARA